MANKKHYIITAVTLGVIAASSGALIGVANLVTRNQIALIEKNKIKAGIVDIFGEFAVISKEESVSDYKYVNYVYEVSGDNDQFLGYAYRTSGSNMYGKISLLVGFAYETKALKKFTVVVNEQTYASTLVDKYINPLNDKEINIDDVSCGATYGAKLVREMLNEATQASTKKWKN